MLMKLLLRLGEFALQLIRAVATAGIANGVSAKKRDIPTDEVYTLRRRAAFGAYPNWCQRHEPTGRWPRD